MLREAVRIGRTWEGLQGTIRCALMLAMLSQNLLMQQRYTEAEPLAREALATQDKHRPHDWNCFNAMSLLGGALLGQQKYPEAEPLLLRGYEGLREREHMIQRPQYGRLLEAGERLARLYGETGRAVKARAVRDELARLAR
jgi:hypothetical protein